MPGQNPPPKKKGMSTGCLIALLAIVVFLGSIAAVAIYIGYTISNNKDVQNVMGALGDVAQIALEAQNAPGTAQLRAIGCEQAMALDPIKMQKLGEKFLDGGPTPPANLPANLEVERIVMCQVGAFGTPPTCDNAAKAYISGASPRKNFMLSVQSHKHTTCTELYSPTGTAIAAPPHGKLP